MTCCLHATLFNPGERPVEAIVYGGSLFEVLDPYAGVQNLVAIRDVRLVVPPGRAATVPLATWCLNRSFRTPQETVFGLTCLCLGRRYETQGQLWADLDRLGG